MNAGVLSRRLSWRRKLEPLTSEGFRTDESIDRYGGTLRRRFSWCSGSRRARSGCRREASAVAAGPQQKDKEKRKRSKSPKTRKRKTSQRRNRAPPAAQVEPHDRVHDRRGNVGFARRFTRRQDDRLRPARRPVYRGDLGGDARAISTGPAFDSQPRYSPDGKSIAFVSDHDGAENLWVAANDGSGARPLSKDKQSLFVSPSWTTEGDYVLVSRQPQLPWGAFDLWMYHIRGGSGIAITKGKTKPDATGDDYVHAIGAVASRDGKHVYYTKRNKLFNAYNNLVFPLSQVVRRDRTTGDEDTITAAPGSGFRPLLSPDGSKLVFGTRVDNQTGPAHPRSLDRRGAMAEAARATRRTRIAVHPRPDPRLCVHSRR